MNQQHFIAYMTPVDWTVIAVYGLGMLAIGAFFARRTQTAEDYLLGGRRMRPSSIGLSLFATLLSTITYLAIPGEMINKGPVILWWMATLPLIYLLVGYLLIPQVIKVRATSAYEILETRLGPQIRLLGSTMFLLTRLVWMALIIYITSDKIIVTMMGWDPSRTPYVAAVIGLITVIYTTMGGLRAVVLADVIQSFILLGGAIACLVRISIEMGGVTDWWPREWSPAWDPQPFFSLDPTVRVTVLGSLVFMLVWWVCTAGSDQMAIQRYLATRDARAARRAFFITLLANMVVTGVLVAVGFALLGFFQAHPPEGMTVEQDADRLFPYYIVHFLPPGVTGLVIAGLLAAAMSSLSSGINSASSVIGSDFIERFRRKPDPEWIRVRRARIIALLSGVVVVLLSLMMSRVSGNIMEVTVRTNHVFVAPLFGLFFMAIFVPFATRFGTALGALSGALVAILIACWDIITGGSPLSFQWISLCSLTVNLIVGCSVSWIQTGGKKDLRSPI